MNLRDWDVWHVYSSFLSASSIDLTRTAEALVALGLAECVLERDGRTWWNGEQGVVSGVTTIELSQTRRSAQISLELDRPGTPMPQGYAAEAWHQASYFRFGERRVFGESPRVPPNYLRAVLGEFRLGSTESGFVAIVYPVVKVFQTGVVLVEFRTIAPDRDIDLKEFIDRFVNLAYVAFDTVDVPPAISVLSPQVDHQLRGNASLHARVKFAWLASRHEQAVREQTRIDDAGDFQATLAPLGRNEGEVETLAGLSQTIMSLVGYAASRPRSGLSFVLRGQRSLVRVGDWWSGRPHVHLLDFDGQSASASETMRAIKAQLGWILSRHPGGDDSRGVRYLVPNLRHFDDYAAFISPSASIWAWSLEGRAQQETFADPNRGHLIYEHQATGEMLEYGYILHRALLARTSTSSTRPEDLFVTRQAVNDLRGDMSDVSQFGEIRELLQAGWAALGAEDLRARIVDNLSLQESISSLSEQRRSERTGRWLASALGVVATPPLATEVVRPFWTLVGWWSPPMPAAATLFFVLVAAGVVSALIGLVTVLGRARAS